MVEIKKVAKSVFTFCVVTFILSSCSFPGIRLYESSFQGEPLNVGEEKNVHFFTKDPNFGTGINLQFGARYTMDISILSYWIDQIYDQNENGEPINEMGFANSVMRYEWLTSTKRSPDHNWFELMLYQSRCSRNSLRGVSDLEVDDSGSYNFVAACDGELTLFVNDSRGFYGNNVGYANISLSRLN